MKNQPTHILAAELIGFQKLIKNLPPEDLPILMEDIYHMVDRQMKWNHASVNRFTGDTFLAVFEKSSSKTSHAYHALNTAFELKEMLHSYLKRKNLTGSLSFKFGIAYGGIFEGEIKSGQKTVWGEAVNHALRFCQFAVEGQIIIDSSTHNQVKDSFEFQILEPIPCKGNMESLEVFEPLKKKRKKLQLQSNSKRFINSAMVGRIGELDQLNLLIKQLISGKGSVVNIIGKAGIGKSRLISELKAQPLLKKLLLLEGRAMSSGKNLSFHPIISLIKSWAGISEDDLPSASSEKLRKAILHIAPYQADDIYAFIATMMGYSLKGKHAERVKGIEGEALEKLILKNLRDLIICATKDKPRIYLIEDMHWADNSSLAIFESLYKLSQDHPVMFINVLRPGYKDTGDYILKWLVDNLPEENTTINVSPLADGESVQLINNLLKKATLPEKVASTIIQKTEGNPFFIEEVIRSFLDEGIIEVHDKEFIVTKRIKGVNIPETINDVILSRVDKLDQKTRELLNTASVMGRNFYYKVLEEATDTIEELDDRLTYLTEVQLISESKKKKEIEYLFKHALAQQATYESILLDNKKEIHLKIARSIEKVFYKNLNEFYAVLAYHYEKAERPDLMEEYLILAGDEAMKTGASSEAIHYYMKILMTLGGKPFSKDISAKTIALEEKLAYAYYTIGETKKAAELFIKVTPSYGFVKVPRNKILFLLMTVYSLMFFYLKFSLTNTSKAYKASERDEKKMKLLMYQGEAMVSFNPREGILRSICLGASEPMHVLINTNHGLGFLYNLNTVIHWSGRALWLEKKINRFIRNVKDDDLPFIYFTRLYYETMSNYLSGQLITDSSNDEIVFKYAMSTGRIWATTVYHVYKGIGYVELGMKKEVLKLIDHLYIITSLEHSFSLTQYYRLKMTYFLKFRKMEDLLGEAKKGIEAISKTDHSSILLLGHSILSMAYSLHDNLPKAQEHLTKSKVLAKKLWVKYYASMANLSQVYYDLAKIKRKGNSPSKSEANELLKHTKELIFNSKSVYCNKTEAYRLRAISYFYAQKTNKAAKCLKKSIDFAHYYGSKLEGSRTYFETGKFLSDPNVKSQELDGKAARHYLENAKSMFEEMDLQWDLEEYRTFTSH